MIRLDEQSLAASPEANRARAAAAGLVARGPSVLPCWDPSSSCNTANLTSAARDTTHWADSRHAALQFSSALPTRGDQASEQPATRVELGERTCERVRACGTTSTGDLRATPSIMQEHAIAVRLAHQSHSMDSFDLTSAGDDILLCLHSLESLSQTTSW